jgi:hypothetical protein
MIGRIDRVSWIKFRQHSQNGTLSVFTGEEPDGVPFPMARIFTITGVQAGARRGNHAHRACSQLVVCLSGGIDVILDDGHTTATHSLKADGTGILIPPMIWNTEVFDGPATVLMVICDEPYDADEYIRDWNEYIGMNGGFRPAPPSS